MCIHICRYILIFRLETVLPTVTILIYLCLSIYPCIYLSILLYIYINVCRARALKKRDCCVREGRTVCWPVYDGIVINRFNTNFMTDRMSHKHGARQYAKEWETNYSSISTIHLSPSRPPSLSLFVSQRILHRHQMTYAALCLCMRRHVPQECPANWKLCPCSWVVYPIASQLPLSPP